MTEKKKYEKPSQKVIELQHQAHLLQASAGVQNYTTHDYEEE